LGEREHLRFRHGRLPVLALDDPRYGHAARRGPRDYIGLMLPAGTFEDLLDGGMKAHPAEEFCPVLWRKEAMGRTARPE
jgi:hypothetical protein